MASKDADVEDVFTLEEVRRLSDLSVVELDARIEAGVLRGRRLGRRFVSTCEDVLAFLEAEGVSRPKLRMAGSDSGGGITFGKRGRVMASALGTSMLLYLLVFGIAFLVIDRRGHDLGPFGPTGLMATRVVLTTASAGLVDRARGAIAGNGRALAARDRTAEQALKTQKLEARRAREMPDRTVDRERGTHEANPRALQAINTASIDSTPPGAESAEGSRGEALKVNVSGVAGATLGPYRPGAGVTAPLLISRVQPDFPPAARAAGTEGTVDLEIIVSSNGSVGNISVLRGPRNGLGFEEAAVAAVRHWRFLPGSHLGKPVDVIAEVTVDFTIDR